MITVKIENKEYNVPTSWNDISVNQYINLTNVYEQSKANEWNILRLKIELLKELANIPQSQIEILPVSEFDKILVEMDFIRDEFKEEIKDYIIIDDIKYVIKKDLNNFSVGEMISIETLMENEPTTAKGIKKSLPIFLRKEVDGQIEKFTTGLMVREEYFADNVSINDVYNLYAFFLNGNNESAINLEAYLNNPTLKQKVDSKLKSL